jgi:hypothetical protein
MKKKKVVQRIIIGLVSFFILALIGLNIYEYRKVICPSRTINSEASISYNIEFGSAQAKEKSTAAPVIQVKKDLGKEKQVKN